MSIAWSVYHNGVGTYVTPMSSGHDGIDAQVGPFHLSAEGNGSIVQIRDDMFGGQLYATDYAFTEGHIHAGLTIEEYGFVCHHAIYFMSSDINVMNTKTSCYAVNLTSRLRLNTLELLKLTNGIYSYVAPSEYTVYTKKNVWEFGKHIDIDVEWAATELSTRIQIKVGPNSDTMTLLCDFIDEHEPLTTTQGEGCYTISHNGLASVHYEYMDISGTGVIQRYGSPVFPSEYVALPMTTVANSE